MVTTPGLPAGTTLVSRSARAGVVGLEQVPIPEPSAREVVVCMAMMGVCGISLHRMCGGLRSVDWPMDPGQPGQGGAGTVAQSTGSDLQSGHWLLTDAILLGWAGRCVGASGLIGAGANAVPEVTVGVSTGLDGARHSGSPQA